MSGYLEIAAQARDLIEQHDRDGLDPTRAQVSLVIPRGWACPDHFPKIEIVRVKPNGDRVAYVSAMEILAWLVATDLVKLELQTTDE